SSSSATWRRSSRRGPPTAPPRAGGGAWPPAPSSRWPAPPRPSATTTASDPEHPGPRRRPRQGPAISAERDRRPRSPAPAPGGVTVGGREGGMRPRHVARPGPVGTGGPDGSPLVARDTPVPAPGPGELLLRVLACGVCRTDLHVTEGDLPVHRPGVTPGHEV